MGRGLLVALPLESLALRVTIAAVVVALLLRPLAARALRTATGRITAGLAPFVVLVAALALALPDPRLPDVLVPTSAAGSLLLPVGDRYVPYAPMAVAAVLIVWVGVSLLRLVHRAWQAARVRAEALREVHTAPPRIDAAVGRIARRMGIAPVPVRLVEHRRGGASVVGVRRPVVVLDAGLVSLLDHDELEGVLAHELAHVRRRDNLLAWAVGTLRDALFFVPGVAWAARLLMREREVMADRRAVAATGRPGALASGLLKVLETEPGRGVACAALAPSTGLVDRIGLLVEPPQLTPVRRRLEVGAVALVALVGLAAAIVLPAAVIGIDREREALGLMLAPAGEPSATPTLDAEPRAFSVYRRSSPTVATAASAPVPFPSTPAVDADRLANLRACASEDGCLVAARTGLGLQPRPVIVVDAAASARWQATPVGSPVEDGRFGVYWLARPDGPLGPDDRLVASLID